jgi:hypothetical protein
MLLPFWWTEIKRVAEIGCSSATPGATATANAIAPMRTLPGFRAALITPGGSTLVRIRRGLQT